MSELTIKEVWMALTPGEKDDACLAFWEGANNFSREAQPRVIQELTTALRFRESFVKRMRPVEKARHLKRLIESPVLQHLASDVLRSWLVARKAPMLACFVETQGIPHTGGVIDDDIQSPDETVVRRGVQAVRDGFPAREVAIYLGVMLASSGDFWTRLPAIVAEEVPDLRAALSRS